MKTAGPTFLFAICISVLPIRAGEMKGTVKSVSGDTASVAMEGDVMPPNGAKAEYFFKLGNDEVSVATGTALHIDRGELRVSIENATGAVEPGHLVRFPGTTGGASASTAAAPPPNTTASVSDGANGDPFLIVPNESPAYVYLSRASAQYKAKDIDAAIAALTEGIAAAPSIGELYLMRANLYLTKKNKAKAAIADASKALELKSVRPFVAYLIRGTSKGDLGNYKAAIADLDKAIKEKPDYGAAYSNRANYKLGARDFRGALADSNKSIELRPDIAEPYVNRGFAYAYLGDYSTGLSDLRHAFEINPALADDKDIKAKAKELEKLVRKGKGKHIAKPKSTNDEPAKSEDLDDL
jgi:tetratricopeptide (TPR) repeat protein